MIKQTRLPLFTALTVNRDAIAQEFDYLTPDMVEEAAELFEGYLNDPDAWDMMQGFALDIYDRHYPAN